MNNIKVIAFYLPQYHPIRENNEWFGPGFTEWTNVGQTKPLFRGHYQPKVPADLGYYDLRLPQVREQQEALAKEAGIEAFCYYHYWFGHGRQMLEKPLTWMLQEKGNMPFCICWANHIWYKKTWNSEMNVLDKRPLLNIDYGDEIDWQLHFETLLPAFLDKRYYKIDGRLAFVLYRIQDIPHVDEFKALWNKLAVEHGLPEFYFMTYLDDPAKRTELIQNSCEKQIVSTKADITSKGNSVLGRKLYRFIKTFLAQVLHTPLDKYNYADIRKKLSAPFFAEENVIPVLIPNWDNTPRRKEGAMILHNATPEQFYLHCKETFAYLKDKKNRVVFLKSWNEWGEGNYMEPDLRYGHGYLQALRRALDEETFIDDEKRNK